MRNWTGAVIGIVVLCLLAGMGWALVTPARVAAKPQTTIYFKTDTFSHGDTTAATDTLMLSSDRNFTDTGWTCAVFATGLTATGNLRCKVLTDSSIAVYSDEADSNLTYCYLLLLQKH